MDWRETMGICKTLATRSTHLTGIILLGAVLGLAPAPAEAAPTKCAVVFIENLNDNPHVDATLEFLAKVATTAIIGKKYNRIL